MQTTVIDPAQLGSLDVASRTAYEWADYRRRLNDQIADAVREIKRSPSSECDASLDALRRIHHVLYVSDRIRKAAIRSRKPVPTALQQTAERVLSKTYSKSKDVRARSPQEELYAVGARVSWHKLLRRAKAESEYQLERGSGAVGPLRTQVLEELHLLLQRLEQSKATNPTALAELDELVRPLQACIAKIEQSSALMPASPQQC
jgi:hypothetical protein